MGYIKYQGNEMKLLSLALSILIFSDNVMAGVDAYVGLSSEVLYIQEAHQLGAANYLVKFSGITSPWADKVFKTKNTSGINGLRLSIDYVIELSSGVQKKSYVVIAETGMTLVNGTLVKTMELDIPGNGQVIKLHYSTEKSQISKNLNLAAEFAKNPFVAVP